jgi:hypothetical protein
MRLWLNEMWGWRCAVMACALGAERLWPSFEDGLLLRSNMGETPMPRWGGRAISDQGRRGSRATGGGAT